MNEFSLKVKPKITIFHCFNAIPTTAAIESDEYEISAVRLPCSSMTRDFLFLRAFEAGADAVAVLVCPEGECRYMEGNIRAGKRVAYVKKILDEIGLGEKRLNIYPIHEKDNKTLQKIIDQILSDLAVLGPNPAK